MSYSVFPSNSTLTGVGSLKINSTGQFASVLLQAASSSSFLASEEALTFIVTPLIIGESGDLSASTVTSTILSLMLLFLQTSAKIVTPQSANAIKLSSSAVGPQSVPPAAVERSHSTLWFLWLSTFERTFSTHVAFAFIFGISFHHLVFLLGLDLKFTANARGGARVHMRLLMRLVCPL